jgi:hypothetical protein
MGSRFDEDGCGGLDLDLPLDITTKGVNSFEGVEGVVRRS